MITVGQITKPQGVRGEVKVIPMTDDPSRFCVLKSVYISGRAVKIDKVRVAADAVYIKLVGVDDRNAAEALRGKYVEIDRAAAVPLGDGEFFIADLIEAALVARYDGDEKNIGIIKAVQSFGAADVFTVDCTDGKEMTFAFVKALCAEFSESKNVLYVDGKRLDEVAVYDED